MAESPTFSAAQIVAAISAMPSILQALLANNDILRAAVGDALAQAILDAGGIGGGGGTGTADPAVYDQVSEGLFRWVSGSGPGGTPTTIDLITGAGTVGKDMLRAETQGDATNTLGLGEVDNTADLDKVISTATQAALDAAVMAIAGVTVSGTAPTAGQVLVAMTGTTAQWDDAPAGGTTVDGISDVPGLIAALDDKVSIGTNGLWPGTTLTVKKDVVTGFWPASWTSDGAPVYTGGSASAGVRPTDREDIVVWWKGPDPAPAIVSSGTGGMLEDVDIRAVH